MAICQFAQWLRISGPVGPYTSGPFKIIHHTTEGASASGAFDAFHTNRSDPHFTVDSNTIYQHIDTALAARALKNQPGGVQTNKDSALQIEVVGFAHLPKNADTLRNVARLCRWLESTHGVSRAWPNGLPKVATPSGHDPGGHNRNAQNWEMKSGHFGHSQVPENTHWDPGYSLMEINFLMQADFAPDGTLLYEDIILDLYGAMLNRVDTTDLGTVESTMEDHGISDNDEYDRY